MRNNQGRSTDEERTKREKVKRKNEKRLHGITVEPFSFISGSEDIAGRETRRQNFADTNYFYSYVQSCSQLRRLAPVGKCTDPQRFPARRDVASKRQSCRPWRTRRAPRRPPETNRGDFDSSKSPRQSRADRIRTCDLLTPSQTRYQAALRPELVFFSTISTISLVSHVPPWQETVAGNGST